MDFPSAQADAFSPCMVASFLSFVASTARLFPGAAVLLVSGSALFCWFFFHLLSSSILSLYRQVEEEFPKALYPVVAAQKQAKESSGFCAVM